MTSTEVLLLSAVATIFIALRIYRLFTYPNYVSPLRRLPGPNDHHLLIGHFLRQYHAGSPNEPYVSWAKRWPDAPFVRFLTIGNAEALLVNSAAAYRAVTRTHCYRFVKPAFFVRLVGDTIGNGLVFAAGNEHRAQRKVLNGVFSIPNMKRFLPDIQDRARSPCDSFDGAIAEKDGIVELTSAYSQLALEITASFVLGIDLLALPDGKQLHDSYKYVFDPPAAVQLLTFLHVIVVPVRWLPLASNREFVKHNRLLRRSLRGVVRRRVEEVSRSKRKGELDAKTETHGDKSQQQQGKDLLTLMAEEGWSEEDMLDQVLTFTAAGHETTATALVWAAHALTLYPDIAHRLHSEITTALPQQQQQQQPPSYTTLESLHYLDIFSRELFRFFCPAAVQARVAVEDVTVEGTTIPRGTEVLISPAALHRNPRIWGDDADVFDPDRWDRLREGGEGRDTDIDPDTVVWGPFLQGPRMCIGRALAWLEFKAVLVEMVRRFQFESVEEGEVRLVNPAPVLRPRGGLRVRVVRRE